MNDIGQLFSEELENPLTNYFILDTHKNGNHEDIDFAIYSWDTTKFNQLKKGDLFIYRRPQSSSEVRNQFYFFGVGKIASIESSYGTLVKARIEKPVLFKEEIIQNQLFDFHFTFKQRKNNWEHFFNQYGMNKINKIDFINLISLTDNDVTSDLKEMENEIELYQKQLKNNYEVEDKTVNIKTRGSAQNVFARKVNLIYGYECAITGIKTRDFLVASHIKPWAEDKENRINPSNGICLSSLVDKAFDRGYIAFSDKYEVVLSKKVLTDINLYSLLKQYEGKKLKYNKKYPPNLEFIQWHRNNIFKK